MKFKQTTINMHINKTCLQKSKEVNKLVEVINSSTASSVDVSKVLTFSVFYGRKRKKHVLPPWIQITSLLKITPPVILIRGSNPTPGVAYLIETTFLDYYFFPPIRHTLSSDSRIFKNSSNNWLNQNRSRSFMLWYKMYLKWSVNS